MPVSATLCSLPLSTTFDAQEEKSKLSLNWVLQNGIRTVRSVASGILTVPGLDTGFSVHMDLPVAILSSPFDVILGRDWLQYCRESVPNSRLCLSSGVVELGRRLIGTPCLYLSNSRLLFRQTTWFTLKSNLERLRHPALSALLPSPFVTVEVRLNSARNLVLSPLRSLNRTLPTTHGTLRARMQADPFSDQLYSSKEGFSALNIEARSLPFDAGIAHSNIEHGPSFFVLGFTLPSLRFQISCAMMICHRAFIIHHLFIVHRLFNVHLFKACLSVLVHPPLLKT
ncbi:hypothetical protein K438DRAFT_1970727 [Mycena galopus ATCC 62051]|nr:hypothetical protein K438DRAFT_1970727 [Mycena galopus ATCC 62051]